LLASLHSILEEATRLPPASVFSSHDKLNGAQRLVWRIGYEEVKGSLGVPNGTRQTTERLLSFSIDLLVVAA